MTAVQQGLAFSTAAGPRKPQQPSFEAGEPTPTTSGPVPPGGGEDPFGGGGGGTDSGYTQTNSDGSKTVYQVVNGQAVPIADIPPPRGSVPTLPAMREPFGPENRARGIYPQAPQDQAYTDVPLYSQEGAGRLGLDYGDLTAIKALKEAGLMTTDEASDLLFGKDGSGGGTTAYQSAQLARQAQQDEWNQILDYIGAAADERQLQAQMQSARRNALIQAAPDLAGGQEFRGGFGPYGGQTLLEMMRGGPGAPRSMRPVPLDLGPEPVDPELVNQLLGPLMGRG